MHRGERARSIARPCGPDRPPSTGAEGDPERTARILRAAEAEAEAEQSESTSIAAKPLPQKEKSLWELWERLQPRCFCAQDARRSSTGVPLRPGERVEDQPEGARARCARVRCGPWMDRQRTPPPDRAVSGQEPADRAAGGVFSLGDFSLDKQREVTGPQGCGTNLQGCGSVIAKKPNLRNNENTWPGRTCRDMGRSSRRRRPAVERKARRANPTNTGSAGTRNTPATPALRRRADAPVCPSRSTSTRRGVPTPAIPARSVRGRARR